MHLTVIFHVFYITKSANLPEDLYILPTFILYFYLYFLMVDFLTPVSQNSAFDNGLADHKSALKTLNGNNPAKLCTNLVNVHPHPTISEFTLLKLFLP